MNPQASRSAFLCVHPTFSEELAFYHKGYRLTAGIDEVGRGALAGPVVASAVVLSPVGSYSFHNKVRDSKVLTAKSRQELFSMIVSEAITSGVGIVSSETIDAIGIVAATKLAMVSAVNKLIPKADSLLIDYIKLNDVDLPQKSITHGDSLCVSIACASIVAKVTRDKIMEEFEKQYHGYGLCNNKGYGTQAHYQAIDSLGLSAIHRKSFCHKQYRMQIS